MADHHEVLHERLYLKEPRTERFRKSAAGRLRHLLATGWRETERWHADDHITVKLERSGHAPRPTKMPKIEAPAGRPPRDRDGRGGGGGGFRGGGGGGFRGGGAGGPGGPRGGGGGPRGGAGGAGAPRPAGGGAPPRA